MVFSTMLMVFLFGGEYVLSAEDGGYRGTCHNSAYIMQGTFWVNNHAHVFQALREKRNNTFLIYLFNFLDLAQYISGSTRGKLNQGVMKNIQIPLPRSPSSARLPASCRRWIGVPRRGGPVPLAAA
ncbi:restriction endonuclease subunit S [Limisphaera sp. 4302-co]|uniref:restriction endonuclease subunit S n=1 Tax=Limisphaera sp. 4302-co TaxID=3400417 RepID=UPI003C25DD70